MANEPACSTTSRRATCPSSSRTSSVRTRKTGPENTGLLESTSGAGSMRWPFATNGESARQRVPYGEMARNRSSSIGAELGWLALFLVIFIAITYCMLRFVVPLHFNDRIAVILSAIVSGVIWVAVRAWYVRRAGNAPP